MATPIKENTTALEELLDRARALPSVPGSVEQATPTISVSSGGLITASATQAAGVVAAGTKSATRQLPTKGATTIEPSDEVQTAVSAGTYVTGDIKVAAQTGGGSAVQVKEGTITLTTTDGRMETTINLGFAPDFVTILIYETIDTQQGSQYQAQLNVYLTDIVMPMNSVNVMTDGTPLVPGQPYATLACMFSKLANGLTLSFSSVDMGYRPVDITNAILSYKAFKLA